MLVNGHTSTLEELKKSKKITTGRSNGWKTSQIWKRFKFGVWNLQVIIPFRELSRIWGKNPQGLGWELHQGTYAWSTAQDGPEGPRPRHLYLSVVPAYPDQVMVAILYRSYALNPKTNIVVINVVIVLDFVFNNFSHSVGRSKIILQLI